MAGPWYVKSGVATEWAASTAYTTGAPGSLVVAKRSGSGSAYAKSWVWECTTAGTSGGTEPTWPSSAVTAGTTTVTDNTVVWTARDPSSGWSYASPYLDYVGAGTRIAAGEIVYVSYQHAEAPTTAVNCTFPGASNNPNLILSVDQATGTPPTALRAGASIAPSGTNLGITLTGCYYMFGVTLATSTGSGTASISTQSSGALWQVLENCALQLNATGTSSSITPGTTGGNPFLFRLVNSTLQGAATGQSLIAVRTGRFEWIDTPNAIQGATIPNTIINLNATSLGYYYLRGVDLSAAGSGKSLFALVASAQAHVVRVERCKYNASATLVTNGSSSLAVGTVEFVECDSGTALTTYTLNAGGVGSIASDTANYKSASVTSDGLNPFSFKLTCGTSSKALLDPIYSPWLQTYVETTGSHTVSVDILYDASASGTLDGNAVWLEVEYLGDAASLRSTMYYGRATSANLTNYLAFLTGTAGSALPAGATWTTSGLTTPTTSTLTSGALTVNQKGLVRARVCVGLANVSVWVDPKITVT